MLRGQVEAGRADLPGNPVQPGQIDGALRIDQRLGRIQHVAEPLGQRPGVRRAPVRRQSLRRQIFQRQSLRLAKRVHTDKQAGNGLASLNPRSEAALHDPFTLRGQSAAMEPASIPLFALADQRLAWLNQRQGLLSQNLANIDTPGFKPRDLMPFAQSLAQAEFTVTPVLTDPADLAGTEDGTAGSTVLSGEQAPDGNAVSLDQQLMRVADTDTQHELVTDLYTKYLAMFRTAIGR